VSVVEGKRVLITGGSSGIGAALAVAMARAGATVGVCARRGDLLGAVAERCRQFGREAWAWELDLSRLGAIGPFAARVHAELGGVDVLVNNAGVPKRRAIARLTPAEVDAVMTVNYLAPVHLTLALLPGMLKRGEGRVYNVASVASRLGGSGEAAYAASKAALGVFTEALAAETAERGIVVQLAVPGPIDTDLVNAPGEDPPLAARAGVARTPLDEAVAAIMAHLESGTFECWIPESFRDIYRKKALDPEAAVATAAGWFSELERQVVPRPGPAA
jgi:NAD(P)-dependent dehydrogenase (short-subunit alcohol dehydrogenase family)